eukprot:CAMPEP_0114603250 /NCGR_PEP_ID=MMETSP0125-20121206/25687_1 /TAXON_ID=485358 ORGANISM="Aristerostoma sp., Strain ATCC 50986" /NCGR_SAMPLE_ID=MMETSP0125 /ASSEMBLY_ACC=CAM_ASM_000245 /LENGTH=65 /DNA_ID=CAMNT_0001813927 /DNA_START=28 /DNA_END=225 /DNA_ORIENTATION=+
MTSHMERIQQKESTTLGIDSRSLRSIQNPELICIQKARPFKESKRGGVWQIWMKPKARGPTQDLV